MPSEIQNPIVRRDKEGPTVEILGGRLTFKVLSDETGGAYAIIEQTVPPGHGPPLHVHRKETEIFYVAAGTFEVQCGEDIHRLNAGSLFVGPRDIPHRFENVGETPGRLIADRVSWPLCQLLSGGCSRFHRTTSSRWLHCSPSMKSNWWTDK